MVSTFAEWKEALRKERQKLLDVFSYLNERGKDRNDALQLLESFSEFCDTAIEMVAKLNDPKSLSDEEAVAFQSSDTRAAIKALRRVAELEQAFVEAKQRRPGAPGALTKEEIEQEKKPEYFVTFRVDARFEATVCAFSTEEALKEAQARFADADFGEATDIDGEVIIVEDEDGNYVFEK